MRKDRRKGQGEEKTMQAWGVHIEEVVSTSLLL